MFSDIEKQAFPSEGAGSSGMTLRDYFAIRLYETALKLKPPGPRGMIDVAERAYGLADDMIEARDK